MWFSNKKEILGKITARCNPFTPIQTSLYGKTHQIQPTLEIPLALQAPHSHMVLFSPPGAFPNLVNH